MDRASKLPKIKDQDVESKFGYVYAVSGPGMFPCDISCMVKFITSCKICKKKLVSTMLTFTLHLIPKIVTLRNIWEIQNVC